MLHVNPQYDRIQTEDLYELQTLRLDAELIRFERELNAYDVKQYDQLNVPGNNDEIGCLAGCKKTKHLCSIILTTLISLMWI